MIREGDRAPDFILKDSFGRDHSLSQYRGQKVVLYFYPADDTPSCTKEACAFRDDFLTYEDKNVVILGISPDSEESHKKFEEKHALPFILLADPKKEAIKAYEVGGGKTVFGKKFTGFIRSTFVIDENGNIMKAFHDVNVDNHSKEILDLL